MTHHAPAWTQHLVKAALLTAITLVSGASLAQRDDAPLFQKAPWSELMQQSRLEGTLLVSMITAEDCQPCSIMNRTTMRSPRVESWFDQNARIAPLYQETDANVYADWNITAMPTFIMWHRGREVARVIGGQTPEVFIAWLNRSADSTNAVPLIADASAEDMEGGPSQSLADTVALIASGENDDKASKDALALWRFHTLNQQGKADVARLALTPHLRTLAARHTATNEVFTAMRDQIDTRTLEGRRASNTRIADFLALSRVTGDTEAAIAWFEAGEDNPIRRSRFGTARHHLSALLAEEGRIEDISSIVPGPAGAGSDVVRRLTGGVKQDDPARPVLRDAALDMLKIYTEVASSMGRDNDINRLEGMMQKLDR